MYLHRERNGHPLKYLAWRILWTEGPGGLPSMGLDRIRHDWSDLAAAAACIFKFSFSFSLVQLFLNWENKNISSLSILLFICAPFPFSLYLALTGLVMAQVLHRKQAMIQVSSLTCSLSHPCSRGPSKVEDRRQKDRKPVGIHAVITLLLTVPLSKTSI